MSFPLPIDQYSNFLKAVKKGKYKPAPNPGPPQRYFRGGAYRFGRGAGANTVWMDAYQACKIGPCAGPSKFTKKKQVPAPVATPKPMVIDLTDSDGDEFGTPTDEDIHQAIAFEHTWLAGLNIKEEIIDPEYYANEPLPLHVHPDPDYPKHAAPPSALLVMSPRHLEMARDEYKGRFYRSTLLMEDLQCQENVENWLITTSTLAQLNTIERTPGTKPIISIELPGAEIHQMMDAVLTEFAGIRHHPSQKILVCCGLNDMMHSRSLQRTKLAALILKMNIKECAPNAKIDFVGIPLAPYASSLTADDHNPQVERTEDIIALNHHLKLLSDGNHDLTLQHEGVRPPAPGQEQVWRVEGETYVTGNQHVDQCWRETLSQAVHLSDDVRREFWQTKIMPYFY